MAILSSVGGWGLYPLRAYRATIALASWLWLGFCRIRAPLLAIPFRTTFTGEKGVAWQDPKQMRIKIGHFSNCSNGSAIASTNANANANANATDTAVIVDAVKIASSACCLLFDLDKIVARCDSLGSITWAGVVNMVDPVRVNQCFVAFPTTAGSSEACTLNISE
jgi:hypothetical protein